MSAQGLSRILFAGTPIFASVILKHLLNAHLPIVGVYTQPDRPAGRGMKLQMSPTKQLALEYHIPVYQPPSLKSPEDQQILKNLSPDILIVAAYGLILPQTILDIPPLGCVNVHASLLPRWRGAAPIIRAIEAGDETSGITLMQMDAGLDTGGIISKWPCPISSGDTSQTLHDRLAELGGRVLCALLKGLEKDDHIVAIPQPEEGVSYAQKVSKPEAQIDWSRPAIEIERCIRAFNPFPGAYTQVNGVDHVKIWQAECLDAESTQAPGSIIKADRFGLDVVTGKGVLRIASLQMPGAKPTSIADFLNSHAFYTIG